MRNPGDYEVKCLHPKRVPNSHANSYALEQLGMDIQQAKGWGLDVNKLLRTQWVSCRVCIHCRLIRQYEWKEVLLRHYAWHQEEYGGPAVFLTLTYNNDHLPYTVHKKAGMYTPAQAAKIRKWERYPARSQPEQERRLAFSKEALKEQEPQPTLKRQQLRDFLYTKVQDALGYLPDWFACGEEGENATKRPHMHALLFLRSYEDLSKLRDPVEQFTPDGELITSGFQLWDKCNFERYTVQVVEEDRIFSYVAKDICKSRNDRELVIMEGREPTFTTHSKYLAPTYVDDLVRMALEMKKWLSPIDFELWLTNPLGGLGYIEETRMVKGRWKKVRIKTPPHRKEKALKALAEIRDLNIARKIAIARALDRADKSDATNPDHEDYDPVAFEHFQAEQDIAHAKARRMSANRNAKISRRNRTLGRGPTLEDLALAQEGESDG